MISNLNLRASILLGLGLAAWPSVEHPAARNGAEPESESIEASAGRFAPLLTVGSPASETDGETFADGATGRHSHPHANSLRQSADDSRVRPFTAGDVAAMPRVRLPGWATTLPPPTH